MNEIKDCPTNCSYKSCCGYIPEWFHNLSLFLERYFGFKIFGEQNCHKCFNRKRGICWGGIKFKKPLLKGDFMEDCKIFYSTEKPKYNEHQVNVCCERWWDDLQKEEDE